MKSIDRIGDILNRMAVDLAIKDEPMFEAEKRAKAKLHSLLISKLPEYKPLITDEPLDVMDEGEKFCVECGQSKLKDPMIPEIREKHKDGTSVRKLAVEYSVSETTIYNVVKNITWRHITRLESRDE